MNNNRKILKIIKLSYDELIFKKKIFKKFEKIFIYFNKIYFKYRYNYHFTENSV